MKQTKHAFTLVEILTVAAMICLIMAVIVVAYNGVYRSWATSNTIAAMKSAQLALEKFKLENGTFPTGSGTLGAMSDSNSKLADDLLQNCSPYSFKKDNNKVWHIFQNFWFKFWINGCSRHETERFEFSEIVKHTIYCSRTKHILFQ